MVNELKRISRGMDIVLVYMDSIEPNLYGHLISRGKFNNKYLGDILHNYMTDINTIARELEETVQNIGGGTY